MILSVAALRRCTTPRTPHCGAGADRPTFEMIYIDGPAGTGKTTTINYIISELRQQSQVCLVAAPTNLASLLYKGGVSAHSLFELLVSSDADETVTSRMKQSSAKAQLIACAKIIVIDELPSLRRADFEAVLQILDILEFRGVLLFSGDFRQIGGVVPRATGRQQVNASPHSSAAWAHVKTFKLEKRHRTDGDPELGLAPDPEWDAHITRLGDGDPSIIEGQSELDNRPLVNLSFVRTKISDKDAAVDFVFGGFRGDDSEIGKCCILSPHNKVNDEWNEYVQAQRPGFLHTFIGKTEVDGDASAADGSNQDGSLLPPEVIENYHESSAPLHVLKLKEGDLVILTRAPLTLPARVKKLCVASCAVRARSPFRAQALSTKRTGSLPTRSSA